MNALIEKQGIWFVYDGECPICTQAAIALRVKKDYGSLYTLNAREAKDHPLFVEIAKRGLDLDEGMVIYVDNQFYHGKEALKFMAGYGESKNFFMLVFKCLFWSDLVARLFYPWMRGGRNWLLRRKKVGRIDNLDLKKDPTFKSIFGEAWDLLPTVMKKHYGNRPYSNEVTRVKGTLEVFCRPPLLWFSPLMKLLGQIPIFNEKNVPVTVYFESDVDTKYFHFNRVFNFANAKTYKFHSRMLQIKDNQVVEIMRFGLAWKMAYSWDGEKVVLSHRGYAIHILGHLVPLPLTLFMGAGEAIEIPIDERTFEMKVVITHPWWGELYGYNGRFEVLD